MVALLLAVIYISFISLGLPDSVLGSAWPIMHQDFNVPVSFSGLVFGLISLCTVFSSLAGDRVTKRFGAGLVTAVSVAITAVALIGFSTCSEYWMLLLWAIPYGLGAGSVDAALNNYVALHFASRHMSWLHCMWGVGASLGPYIMSAAITRTNLWNNGYITLGVIQVVLSAIIFCSLPLWKKREKESATSESSAAKNSAKPLPLAKILQIPGAKAIMLAFFCYCALEQTVGLWASSYLVFCRGVEPILAAKFASLFYIGITAGRGVNGFLTFKFTDKQLIQMGQTLIAVGVLCILLPLPNAVALAGFILVGLGCAPIYPCIIHSTPTLFGRDKSQALIGVQMASAYVGTAVMPPLFGFLSNAFGSQGIKILPIYLIVILAIMIVMYAKVVKLNRHEG